MVGELYDLLVLPSPKQNPEEFLEVDQPQSSVGKNLFHDILPRYQAIANNLAKLGYVGLADLVRFCFDETSEYFTRSVTTEDDETVTNSVAKNLDSQTEMLVQASMDRSKPDAIDSVMKLYQTLAPKWEQDMVNESRRDIAEVILHSLDGLTKLDTRDIRLALSPLADRTYSEEDLTLTINYLHSVFNTAFRELPKTDTVELLVGYVKQLAKGIETSDKLLLCASLDRIAGLACQLRNQ